MRGNEDQAFDVLPHLGGIKDQKTGRPSIDLYVIGALPLVAESAFEFTCEVDLISARGSHELGVGGSIERNAGNTQCRGYVA